MKKVSFRAYDTLLASYCELRNKHFAEVKAHKETKREIAGYYKLAMKACDNKDVVLKELGEWKDKCAGLEVALEKEQDKNRQTGLETSKS